MGRAVRGVLLVEGVQTGDGRVVAEGATTWADLPLPLGWLERQQHGDLSDGGVQIGTLDTIERVGNEVRFTGTIDDGQPDGAEVVRRLSEGVAPKGTRWGMSIDPDDWEVQIVATEEPDEDDALIIVGSGPPLDRRALTAAAGEPDVGDDGVVLFEDSADSVIERYTRLRIRGATAVAMDAFAEAWMELADTVPATDATEPDEEPAAAVAASGCADCEDEASSALVAGAFTLVRTDPLAAWFGLDAEPEDVLPIGIDADTGRIFGYTALWGTCHIGHAGQCVTPPMSPSGYRYFHTGATRFNVGGNAHTLPTGRITMGLGHAPLDLAHAAAVAHYDNTRWQKAAVRNHENGVGIWYSGALHRSTTEAECEALLACGGVSGDWRPIGGALEHVAALAVNVPGFPVPRALTAAAPSVDAQARVGMADGAVTAIVGAGLGAVFAQSGRRFRRGAPINRGTVVTMRPDPATERRIAALERQVAVLGPQVAAGFASRIGRPPERPTPSARISSLLAKAADR